MDQLKWEIRQKSEKTLVERMAKEYDTVWIPEYGREYWEKHQVQRRLSQEQLVEIAEGHLPRENDRIAEANQYLFSDRRFETVASIVSDKSQK